MATSQLFPDPIMLATTRVWRYNVDRMATARITWQEAQLMPEDGKRYEAIDGELYVTPAPTRRHQWVSMKLVDALLRLLVHAGHGWVYHPPTGVEFPDTDEGVQPDIIFVSRARSETLVDEGIRGAPDLVVEILSPSTADRDRTIKKKLYQRQGVVQYWVVDLDAECVEVWDFESSSDTPARYVDRLPVRFAGNSIGEIQLPDIFSPEF
jgi:Uma2 family endonuclease